MNIGIFCSANHDIDRDFFTLTHEFGEWAAKKGHTIVYGGCNMGLMECVAHAAFNAGGRTIGVVPRIVETHGKASDYSTVTIPCDNLSDRKDLLMLHSDVFVALPGGIGTLDEVFTVVASSTIGYHEKKVILYNMKGFWNPLIRMLDDLQPAEAAQPLGVFLAGLFIIGVLQPTDAMQFDLHHVRSPPDRCPLAPPPSGNSPARPPARRGPAASGRSPAPDRGCCSPG